MEIRDFTDDDYQLFADHRNRVFPDHLMTADEWRRNDGERDPEHLFGRLVVEADGMIVAACGFGHVAHMFHPQRFNLNVTVDVAYRRRGLGARLYDAARARLSDYRPQQLLVGMSEREACGFAFATKRGFAVRQRNWESHLAVASFDPSRFAGAIARVEAQGIRLTNLGELVLSDPDCHAKTYALFVELIQLVPFPEPFTPPPFEKWVEQSLGADDLIPEGYLIACDGDQYIGISQLWLSHAQPDMLFTGLTATKPEYQRRGIALALKLKAIAVAQQRGIREIRTDNEEHNRGMLAINEQLGFVRQPALLTLFADLV